jgi:hypothetical protein
MTDVGDALISQQEQHIAFQRRVHNREFNLRDMTTIAIRAMLACRPEATPGGTENRESLMAPMPAQIPDRYKK